MISIFLVPLLIVLVYSTFLLYKEWKLRAIIFGLIALVISAVGILILQNYFSSDYSFLLVILGMIVLMYSVIQSQSKSSVLFTIILIGSIGLLFYVGHRYPETQIFIGFLMMLLFLLAVNNQIFMRKTYEESAIEYQNKIINKQVEEVQNIYITMRGWRHDYHNHLQKLKAHIALNQIKEAEEYLNRLEVDLDNVNQLVNTGNVNLDAILNSKLSLAIKNDINVKYDAKVPENLTVTDIDLCVLIGNLIDNAVEACEKTEKEISKFIRLYIGIFKKQLYISVTNSTNEYVRKLDSEFISNKRGNHGHGLKRINNIVDKYEGFINRQNEPNVFVTEVLLPL